jgi:hypothetical protein
VADVFSEMEGLKRRRALLEAMQKQTMETPIQGDYGIGQLLAKLGTSYLQSQTGKELDSQQSAVDARYQSGLGDEVAKYLSQSQGAPGQTLDNQQAAALMFNDQNPGPLAEPVQGDPLAAVTSAMTSRYPEMQQLGKTALPFMMPKPKEKKLHALGDGGMLVDEAGQVIRENPKAVDQWSDPYNIGPDLYQKHKVTGQIRKLDNAPKISATATAHGAKAEDAFDKSFGTSEGKALSENLDKRPGQIEAINAANTGLQLLDQGIYTGIAAGWKKLGDKALTGLGLSDGEKAARTEQFISFIGDVVIPRLKDFGGNDTVEEMKYLQAVNGGDITLEPGALREVLTRVDQKMRKRIGDTDKAVERWHGAGKSGVPTIPSLMKVPDAYQRPPAPPAGGKPAQAVAPAGAPSAQTGPYSDAEKERRYQEWKRRQLGGQK